MRKALAGLSCFTGAASCWLAVMFVVLGHPGYQWRTVMALLFVVQSVLTLAALAGYANGGGIRLLLLLGAASTVVAGGQALRANASSADPEGYAEVIGLALIIQGALTLWVWLLSSRPAARSPGGAL